MDEEMKKKIDSLSRLEMARLWRFAPVGDPLFQGEVGQYFKERFFSLGGFSPAISKEIGWDEKGGGEGSA